MAGGVDKTDRDDFRADKPKVPSAFNAGQFLGSTVDAINLGLKYGAGAPRDANEVLEFVLAFKRAGLSEGEVCVLGAWLGGAVSKHGLLDVSQRQTAQDYCGGWYTVAGAMLTLQDHAPTLAALVDSKAKAQEVKQNVNEQRNVDEDTRAFFNGLGLPNPYDIPWGKVAVGAGVVVVGLAAWRAWRNLKTVQEAVGG